MERNVLGHAQREISGATTFGKYDFQYHWALCRIIEKHKSNSDYALLIEYHEDVVIADSLYGDSAKFEFFQVKNTGKPFTSDALTKREQGAEGPKSSILGKLLSSCIGTDYEARITEIGLVSSSGFSFDQRDKKLKLDIITSGDLSVDCLSGLTEKLKDELGIALLPENIKFIVPKIKLENQEEFVIGRFAELVNEIFPNSHCNAVNIYRAIIDEIHRKGQNTYDFTVWEKMVEDKSLTSHKVKDVIAVNTTSPKLEDFEKDFEYLAKNDMKWNTLTYRKINKKIKQLFLRRIGHSSAFDMNIMRIVQQALSSVSEEDFTETRDFIESVILKAQELNIEDQVPEYDDILCEIIYSFLKVMHE
ncbi:DUF4297 domain-containing protein [Salmonella enterica]|uniref:DUF4297 domain-containing protein n=1 Tax=Citrobacter koseri TaxID=545 RepID=UPI000F928041|nr:DUF4297 domain-containing protein [Citrobacter koseri]EAX0490770.1 DUF4297 domain-containing protein [Salmonella enterica]EDP9452263.1 DUF4297 domain-containing protein [Salmonella enterica subsp. enterica serovar Inverness]EAY6894815.1 DUF4297 domain-containing protein [Salmonella enterica]EAY7308473.1 DUF4297 domain-containing protein [Salmonella enterica]EBP7070717.1 DUF4297 domain-containing protein [Salmonella enterica]